MKSSSLNQNFVFLSLMHYKRDNCIAEGKYGTTNGAPEDADFDLLFKLSLEETLIPRSPLLSETRADSEEGMKQLKNTENTAIFFFFSLLAEGIRIRSKQILFGYE